MPRVPLPSVALQAAPSTSPQATPVQQGPEPVFQQQEAVGRALQDVGAAASAIGSRFKDQIDRAESRKYDNVFADLVRDTLNEQESRLGQDAVKAREDALQKLAEGQTALAQQLGNDDSRALFERATTQRLQMARSAIDRHTLQQGHVFEVAESKARAESAQLDATRAAVRGDNTYPTYRSVMLNEVNAFADLHGLPESSEQVKAIRLAMTSKLHSDTISQISDQDPARAKSWLEKNASEIDASTGARLSRIVGESSVRHDSTKLAMELTNNVVNPKQESEPPRPRATATVGDIEIDSMTWADQLASKGKSTEPAAAPAAPAAEPRVEPRDVLAPALAELDKRFNAGSVSAEVRDATRSRLFDDERLRQNRRAETTVSLVQQAKQWVSDNPSQSFANLPSALAVELKNNNVYDVVREFARTKTSITDPNAWLEVLRLEESGEIRSLSGPRMFERFLGRLDDGDMQRAEAMRIRSINGQNTDRMTRILSNQDIVNEGLRQAGMLSRDGSDDAEKQRSAPVYRVLKEIDRRLALLGRDAKPDEVQQVTDDVLLDKAYRSVSFGSDPLEPFASMTTEEQETATLFVGGEYIPYSKVPPKQSDEIISRLKARNEWPATGPEQRRKIVELWVAAGKLGATK